MIKVHILTRGFASPNGRAFLFPLHVHRNRLGELGVRFKCFTRAAEQVTDCDALIVDSRFYSHRWTRDFNAALGELDAYRDKTGALLYFDISDSTGWLQSQVLPCVTRYCKAQLLADKKAYLEPQYGNRIYADYYHRENGIEDEEPVWSRPVDSPELLDKLYVSWNSGLADYSRWGPLRMALRQRIPVDTLLRFPRRFTPVEQARPVPVACRFGVGYPRETVSWQRRRIRDMLGARMATGKLGRSAYLAEMKAARVAVSPFGFGEVTLKDFEAFLCGAMLLKPAMTHLETWPDLFRGGETMMAHHWDLSDLEEVLDTALSNDARRSEIAGEGQAAYRRYIASEDGYQDFCLRFRDLITGALAA